MKIKSIPFILISLVFLLGCDSTSDTSKKEKLNKEQTFLVNGYSQMAQILGAFKWTEELLMVKFNSKEIQDFGGRLDEAAVKIGERLKTLSSTEKWLMLDNTGSSELQSKLFSSMTKERITSYAPLVGMDGPIFERTFLLVASGILNQMIHLTDVLLEAEKDKVRLEFLNMAKKSFENLRKEDLKILNTKYFKHNQFDQK